MINTQEVEKIASLARLTLTPDEKTQFAAQLTAILGSFEALAKIDTQGVQPLVTPSEIEPWFREDEVTPGIGAAAALANAPEKMGHLFKVPPVV